MLILCAISPTHLCTVIECGPPPAPVNCTFEPTPNECGREVTYAPLDPDTIRIFGDTTLVCEPDGMWQADDGEELPFCVPSMLNIIYHVCSSILVSYNLARTLQNPSYRLVNCCSSVLEIYIIRVHKEHVE